MKIRIGKREEKAFENLLWIVNELLNRIDKKKKYQLFKAMCKKMADDKFYKSMVEMYSSIEDIDEANSIVEMLLEDDDNIDFIFESIQSMF